MTLFRKALGQKGEAAAADFLEGLGFVILERGWRSLFGELDLVARDGKTLVFVEVKTRASDRFGAGEQAVDIRKQRRMAKAALAYLRARRLEDSPVRFDVVALQGGRLRYIPRAFYVEGYTR